MKMRLKIGMLLFGLSCAMTAAQELTGLRIEGPDQILENSTENYRVFAQFDNEQEFEVTLFADLEMIPGAFAEIDAFGNLSSLEVAEPSVETIAARFDFGEQFKEAQQDVLILDFDTSGYALEFDGDDDYVYVLDSDSLSVTGSVTIEAWVRATISGFGHVVIKDDPRNGLAPYWLFFDNGRLHFRFYDDSNNISFVLVDVGNYNWEVFHHVAGVFDEQAGELRIYIDSELVASKFTEFEIMKNQIGTDVLLGGINGSHTRLEGEMDEIRIWSIARTADQIKQTMNSALCGDENGLVGYWRFNEGEGQIVEDYSRFGNHGTRGDNADPDGEANDPTWVLSEIPLFPVECEEINCEHINKFKVKCSGDTLKINVKSTLLVGTELAIDNNGELGFMIINRKGKGKISWKNQEGIHTVFIDDCPDFLKAVNCGS